MSTEVQEREGKDPEGPWQYPGYVYCALVLISGLQGPPRSLADLDLWLKTSPFAEIDACPEWVESADGKLSGLETEKTDF